MSLWIAVAMADCRGATIRMVNVLAASPLSFGSVPAVTPRWLDGGEGIEVEIDDLLERLRGGGVAKAVGQGV